MGLFSKVIRNVRGVTVGNLSNITQKSEISDRLGRSENDNELRKVSAAFVEKIGMDVLIQESNFTNKSNHISLLKKKETPKKETATTLSISESMKNAIAYGEEDDFQIRRASAEFVTNLTADLLIKEAKRESLLLQQKRACEVGSQTEVESATSDTQPKEGNSNKNFANFWNKEKKIAKLFWKKR